APRPVLGSRARHAAPFHNLGARGTRRLAMREPPVRQRDERGPQRRAEGREGILRRVHAAVEEFAPRHDAVRLELAQVRRQHFLGYSGEHALQVAEAARSLVELAQDRRLPFTRDDVEGRIYGTEILPFAFSHLALPCDRSSTYRTVSYCQAKFPAACSRPDTAGDDMFRVIFGFIILSLIAAAALMTERGLAQSHDTAAGLAAYDRLVSVLQG